MNSKHEELTASPQSIKNKLEKKNPLQFYTQTAIAMQKPRWAGRNITFVATSLALKTC